MTMVCRDADDWGSAWSPQSGFQKQRSIQKRNKLTNTCKALSVRVCSLSTEYFQKVDVSGSVTCFNALKQDKTGFKHFALSFIMIMHAAYEPILIKRLLGLIYTNIYTEGFVIMEWLWVIWKYSVVYPRKKKVLN